MADVEFTKACGITASENLTRLFQELTGGESAPDIARFDSLVKSGQLNLYTAILDGAVVGMVSIVPCRTSLSDKYWIEDVAVLSDCRGRGIGRSLLEYAMEDTAARYGSGIFYLTSRPSRVAARKLYASMGFGQYETGVFKKQF